MTDIFAVPEDAVPILDHGYVRLAQNTGDDLSIVNSARVSFNQRSNSMDQRAKGLINFLMRERHGTPFEHNSMTFEVRAPLVVVREWQRHRIASYNEESGRYSELKPMFYIPKGMVRTQVGKPGAYTFEPVSAQLDDKTCKRIEAVVNEAYKQYQEMLEDGVAKEVARLVLPLNLYSTFYFTTNARALMNFLSLRNDPNAMREIRLYAGALEAKFNALFPVTYQAFLDHGRVAP